LVIGWGTSVKIASIRTNHQRAANGSFRQVPLSGVVQVDIVASFQTSYFISGLAPFGDALVVLAYIPGEEDGDKDFSSSAHSRQVFMLIVNNEMKFFNFHADLLSSCKFLPLFICYNLFSLFILLSFTQVMVNFSKYHNLKYNFLVGMLKILFICYYIL